MKEAQEQNNKLVKDIESLNIKLTENKRMHEKALLELNNLNENLTNEVVKLTNLMKDLEGKLHFEKEKCDDEKITTEDLKRELLSKDKQYYELQRQYDSLIYEKSNVEKQLVNFQTSNDKLVNQFERIMKEKADLYSEVENYKREQHNSQLVCYTYISHPRYLNFLIF